MRPMTTPGRVASAYASAVPDGDPREDAANDLPPFGRIRRHDVVEAASLVTDAGGA